MTSKKYSKVRNHDAIICLPSPGGDKYRKAKALSDLFPLRLVVFHQFSLTSNRKRNYKTHGYDCYICPRLGDTEAYR